MFPVESGHVMQFARAVGETDARFLAAMHGRRDGIPTTPTFLAASAHYDPDWPLRPQPGQPWSGSGRGDGTPLPGTEDGGTALHAEQHYEFHQPVVSGMTLTSSTHTGKEWTKAGRRGGNLHFSEMITEFRDVSGGLVVTVRSVGVRTEQIVGEPA